MSTRTVQPSRRRLQLRSVGLVKPAAVFGGGLLGSAARAAIATAFPIDAGRFPLTTLLVNLAGSFLLGFFLARRQRAVTRGWSLHFWAIGALGSFTTFSAFSVEVFRLIDAAAWPMVVAYVVTSSVLGLGSALVGQRLGRVGR